mmetsp:Transcript_1403/g.2849  ORF Transcript_1403/g.2849 Transcript_1403/m.2849 type:complete len:216 (-) Transcript_1403:431-1078(-)
MGTFHVFMDVSFPSRSECFNGVKFPLFHFGLLPGLDNGNGLSGVNLVGCNSVSVKILDRFDGVCLPINLDLVGLHHFLNGRTDLPQPCVDPRHANTLIGSRLHRFLERIKRWVERNGKRAVDDSPVDVSAKVDFHDIVVVQNGVITLIRCVVCRNMIQGASRWKSYTRLESSLLDQIACGVLQLLAHIYQFDAWSNHIPHHILPHLSVHFCSMPN